MANWKKVDADQLEADLTTVADAIRERSGTAEQMNFPDGFVSAVEGIPDYMQMNIEGQLTAYSNHKVTEIASGSFRGNGRIKSYDFPNVITVRNWAFAQSGLLSIVLPKATTIEWDVFRECNSLTKADFPVLGNLQTRTFYNTKNLETLILRRADKITVLSANDAISSTKIASGTGYIYVPRSLVDSYKAATNWSTYANQFRAIEDYPEITGG